MMPRPLRRLFVRILIYCQPVHPEELWEEFQDAMSQDFMRHFTPNEARKKCYVQINTLLLHEGSSLENLPTMPQITEVEYNDNSASLEEHGMIGANLYSKLNAEQKTVVDIIFKSVTNSSNHSNSKCFYIDGPGGSGKTYTL